MNERDLFEDAALTQYELLKKLRDWAQKNLPTEASSQQILIRGEQLDSCVEEFDNAFRHYHSRIFTTPLNLGDSLDAMKETARKLRLDFDEISTALKADLLMASDKLKEERERKIKEELARNPPAQQPVVVNDTHPRLEPIKIPTFDGTDKTKWWSFWREFEAVVAKRKLEDSERLYYLQHHALKGAAARKVQQLELSNENYTRAVNDLKATYEDRRLIAHHHLKLLLDKPKVAKGDTVALQGFIDDCRAHVHSLKTLGLPTEHWDTILLYLLTQKIDPELALDWEKATKGEVYPTFHRFTEYLSECCSILERRPAAAPVAVVRIDGAARRSSQPNQSADKKQNKSSTMIAGVQSCSCCGEQRHPLFRCRKFQEMSVSDRLQLLSAKGICSHCLRTHATPLNEKCGSKGDCRLCHRKHHTLVHQEAASETPKASSSTTNCANDVTATTFDVALSAERKAGTQTAVLLSVALINVVDKHGNEVPCRALLDSGSTIHLVSKRFAQQLGLKQIPAVRTISGISAKPIESKAKVSLLIKSRTESFAVDLDAHVIAELPSEYPSRVISSELRIPPQYELADPTFRQPQKVELLIGSQLFWSLLKEEREKVSLRGPLLQNSVFGWLVVGEVATGAAEGQSCCLAIANEPEQTGNEDEITKLLRNFWLVEHHDPPVVRESPEDIACEEIYRSTVGRAPDGRFIVNLPFRSPPHLLGASRQVAERRFLRLERRLKSQPDKKAEYVAVMEEFLRLGDAHPVSVQNIPPSHYFLPHHCVFKPESSSTQVRPVFDGSCRTENGKSLNDLLYAGPKIQCDLFDVLIRSRLRAILLSADIGKMYLQVQVTPEHANYQLILWRSDEADEMKVYRFNRLLFGLAPSMFLATRVLKSLADEYEERLPLAAKALKDGFYVDNLLVSCETENEAREIRKQLTELLESACMTLHKWFCSREEVIEDLPSEKREQNITLHDGTEAKKALGLVVGAKDEYRYSINISPATRVTRRFILAETGRLFDPLGLLSPVIVIPKLIFQELCKDGLDWDTEVPPHVLERWSELHRKLPLLEAVSIPRAAIPVNAEEVQLHAFSDASEVAYGAAVYLRSLLPDGTVAMHLLCSKSRVAPIKKLTVAKLELSAALLAAELVANLRRIIDRPINDYVYWSDSETVLYWLAKPSYMWPTFVANRVERITSLAPRRQWRHVPGEENPADIVSRGRMPDELLDCDLWWSGPSFLFCPANEWPNQEKFITESDANDVMAAGQVNLNVVKKDWDPIGQSKFANSFHMLVRIGAYVNRFANRRRRKEPRKWRHLLDATDIAEGTLVAVKLVQAVAFKVELVALRNSRPIDPKSKLAALNPFLDARGVLRVGGRLRRATLPDDAKHPAILPSKHPFTRALFEHYHKELVHAGPTNLLSNIRRRFWPLQGRRLAQFTFRKCVNCFRVQPRLGQQQMGDLPPERITPPPRAFYNVGLDFCGPFHYTKLKRGQPPFKVYIAVYVCLNTKAMHLELCSELSTPAVLACVKRFAARRGRPQLILSDNMKGFVGAEAELKRLADLAIKENTDLATYLSKNQITWRFIPPRAPHQGGLWEAAVKQVKLHLKRSVANALLTWEELETVLYEIEAALNSRPLCPLSEDAEEMEALTPGHFVIGEALTALPEPFTSLENLSHISRWKRTRALRQEFWQRWSDSYLTELQQRGKWRQKAADLKEGQLVLIKEDHAPPLKWLLGRVSLVYPGKDGAVRVARIHTADGEYVRDVRKLAPLPTETPLDDGDAESAKMESPQGGRNVWVGRLRPRRVRDQSDDNRA